MPLDPAFIADCPYSPDALLIDEIVEVDREKSSVIVRMPAHAELPLTRSQRTHPVRHPQHVAGHLTKALPDAPAIQRLERDDFEQQEIEGALDEVGRFAHIGFLGESTGSRSKSSLFSLGKQGEAPDAA